MRRRGCWRTARERPSERQLTWFDRSGTARGTVGDPDGSSLDSPRVSPDGRRVVVARTVQGNTDLWLLDGARMSRVTFDAATTVSRLVARRHADRVPLVAERGEGDLYQKLTSGAGAEERLVASDQVKDSQRAGRRMAVSCCIHAIDPQ